MLKHTITCGVAATALALLTAGPALAADSGTYNGTTSAGTDVVVERAGNQVTQLRAYLPAMCVSSRTSDTKAGTDAFVLPAPVPIGGEQTVSAEQPTALGMGSEGVTKNYRVTLTRGAAGAISGTIHMNWMVVEPYFNAWGYLDGNTFICQADATFTARPAAEPKATAKKKAAKKKRKPAKRKKAKRTRRSRG